MVVLQPLCQVIDASDWSEIARELQWQEVVKVQLIETFALRHNHQNSGSGTPAIGPCSLHPSLFQAKQASWHLREEGRSFSITREPALELDFGWHSILLTFARHDDYHEYCYPSVDQDLNILRIARFDRPRKLLTALSFKELEPMLRSRFNTQGASLSCMALASPRSSWCPWHEKEAKMWASIDKQQIFEWVEVKLLTSDHSFAKRLFEKVSIDFQMLKRAANAR